MKLYYTPGACSLSRRNCLTTLRLTSVAWSTRRSLHFVTDWVCEWVKPPDSASRISTGIGVS